MCFSAARAVIEMTATVIIRPVANGWEWLDPDDMAAGVQSGLPAGGNESSAVPCTLLLPAEQVFLGSAHIATRNVRQLMQAVPFALEEQLAEDPESLHFAVQRTGSDDAVRVAAVSRKELSHYLDELRSNGLGVDRVVPDVLLLPWNSGEVSVLLDGTRALVRSGGWAGGAIEADLLDSWLPMLIDSAEPAPEKIILFSTDQASPVGEWPLPLEARETDHSTLALLARELSRMDFNLLQAEFAPLGEHSGSVRWKWPAIAAAIAVVLAALVNFTELQNLRSASARLEQAIESRFHQSFPQVQRLQDPLIQAERELQRLHGGSTRTQSDFFHLLSGVVASISAQPDLKLTSLRYRNRQMQLELEAGSIDQLEQLQQAAKSAGLEARLESARLGTQGVSGTLTLARSPS